MLAIVITLGGYLAGLHWLVSPPDPWQPSAKSAQMAQPAARKRLPVVAPAEASVPPEATAATEPDTKTASVASVETSVASVGTSEAFASIQTSEPKAVPRTVPIRAEAIRPAAEPAHVVHRDDAPAKARPSVRKRPERNTGRRLELMVLRTYERSDGKRFTRLLPINSARSAMAFQPDDAW
jgi:hypothetical protein